MMRALRSLLSAAGRRIARFGRDTHGGLVVEATMTVLFMSIGYSAFYIYWDAYQAQNRVQKTSYTVSDLISRQRNGTLTRPFLDGVEVTAEFLLQADQDARMRFTQVRRTSNGPDGVQGLTVDWSYSPCGTLTPRTTAGLPGIINRIPMMAVGSSVTIVEMVVRYEPSFSVGLEEQTFRTFVVAMPRFEQSFTLSGVGRTGCI